MTNYPFQRDLARYSFVRLPQTCRLRFMRAWRLWSRACARGGSGGWPARGPTLLAGSKEPVGWPWGRLAILLLGAVARAGAVSASRSPDAAGPAGGGPEQIVWQPYLAWLEADSTLFGDRLRRLYSETDFGGLHGSRQDDGLSRMVEHMSRWVSGKGQIQQRAAARRHDQLHAAFECRPLP